MKPLTIVAATDSQYAILLAALIKSIETNIRANQKIDFYIIDDNIGKTNRNKLLQSINTQITTIHWVNKSDIVPSEMKLPIDNTSYPLNIYLRLFIPHFIPKDIDQVLYIDVDMVVLKDISLLFETDLKNKPLAAVLDPGTLTFAHSYHGISNYKELGFPADTPYFNSGLLLMDAQKWRELNIAERVIECIAINKQYANYPDQYGLNVILANQWMPLDPLWNHFSTSKAEDPNLIHFVWRKPIYKSYKHNPEFQEIFFEYLNKTAWSGTKPIGEPIRYLKKIKLLIYKFKNKIPIFS